MTDLMPRRGPVDPATRGRDGGAPLVLLLEDGNRTLADLMGGKGANLAEMTRLGLPVPAGFTITTAACRARMRDAESPAELVGEVTAALGHVERRTGRVFGAAKNPLLVSVRSGARFSMPGMMETVLDVGLTDAALPGLSRRGGERFAWDCYRRLVQMFGSTVLGVDAQVFERRLADARAAAGVSTDAGLSVDAMRAVVDAFRSALREHTGEDLPQDPREQLDRAVEAVFASWDGARARVYRAHEGIPDDLGTAVNVVEMVYGNTGPRSGSGVCFTRNPSTGAPVPYGDYLPDAQGEDVVSGSRAPLPLRVLAEREPPAYAELIRHLVTLERHFTDLCDVEFTVEDGRLWLLQTRVGKRSPAAAFVIADALVREGVITADEALRRVDGHQLALLLHPRFDASQAAAPLGTGLPAGPGASVGEVVLTAADAVALRAAGHDPVLVRPETSPDDLDGLIAAAAVVTARGGLTSHAAVVARGLGRTCVTSVAGMTVDTASGAVRFAGGTVLRRGDVVSVDGSTGAVYAGPLAVLPSQVSEALGRGDVDEGAEADEREATDGGRAVVGAVRRLLAHADARRTLDVRANADTAADARWARRLGARGVGLCRTEHTLLGTRRQLVERIVTDHGRTEALEEVERLARADFTDLLESMDGLPVVVRLLDPPLHEFLPDPLDLTLEVAAAPHPVDPALTERLATAVRWREHNPMLGLRGVRLLTVIPELVDVHVRALASATRELLRRGLDPRPELMVPLVADAVELSTARRHIEEVLQACGYLDSGARPIPVGSMIELPRAALTAGEIARHADFFSFGTNDLTQTTWGLSRDDASTFLPAYRTSGILLSDPFETIDEAGVGRLVIEAVAAGRAERAGLEIGVCGEHAGDPASIRFFAAAGLDYLSCSPPRLPVARLEAGRATLVSGTVAMADVAMADSR